MLFALLSLGCTGGGEDESTYNWEVKVTSVDNTCTEDNSGTVERFVYELDFAQGSLTDLHIEGERFATGSLTGCRLEYQSQVVGEPDRAGGSIQWVLSGEAIERTGGDTCDIEDHTADTLADWGIVDADDVDNYLDGHEPSELDWIGWESFEIVASEDESIAVGCTYDLLVAGVYLGKDG